MRRYRKWALTLGIMAVTPGIATAAGPLSLFKPKAEAEAEASKPSNQKVADDVGRALKAAQFKGYDIEIECNNGVATLTGKITDARQKALATRLASEVAGVKRVENKLAVLQQGAGASGAARRSPAASPSAQIAEGRKRSRSMIRQVSDEVPAPPAAPSEVAESATAAAIQSNQKFAQDIANALSAARLNSYDIEIRYQNAVALLQGAVAGPEQRALATKAASEVPGVRMVNNQLLIQDQSGAAAPGAMQRPPVAPAGFMPPPGQPAAPEPAAYGGPGGNMSNAVYDMPHLPEYAWPSYASYPNYAQVAYPTQYSASAWPYIGPFYPYPQVPLGWRRVSLEWDDGSWNLNFNSRTDKWWWFLHPKNW